MTDSEFEERIARRVARSVDALKPAEKGRSVPTEEERWAAWVSAIRLAVF